MNRIRVVIADDHILFQQGLKQLLELETEMDMEVVATATSGRELIRILKVARPHILLLDLNMPSMDGLDAFKEVKDWNNSLKVIALTMYDDPKIIKTALKAGVDGYILKRYGFEEVLNAIKDVLSGNVYVGKGIEFNKEKVMLSNQAKFDDKYIRKYRLTKRELEVLQLIGQALSNKEIAKELFISDQTVSVHRKNIMRKLNVSNTAGLIRVAYDQRLIY